MLRANKISASRSFDGDFLSRGVYYQALQTDGLGRNKVRTVRRASGGRVCGGQGGTAKVQIDFAKPRPVLCKFPWQDTRLEGVFMVLGFPPCRALNYGRDFRRDGPSGLAEVQYFAKVHG